MSVDLETLEQCLSRPSGTGTVIVPEEAIRAVLADNERLRAIKRSDTEMIEECRKELAELANNRDGLEHDWSERGASIERLRAELVYEQERNATNVRVYSDELEKRTAENELLRDKVVLEWEEKCAEIALLKGKLTLSGTARALAAEHQLRVERARNDSALMKLARKNERLRADFEDRVKVVAEHRKVIIEQSGRIHAALEEADAALEMFEERSGLEEVVKALKGEV